nr:hypothetical protein [Tanacetum cinerariifolium]
MVNSRQLVALIVDSLKNHIAEAIVVAMATVTKNIKDQVNKSIDAMNESVKGVCIRQDFLCTEMKKLSKEASTSTALIRPNHPKVSRMAKIEFLKFSRDDLTGWVYRCNQFFKYSKIHGEDMLWEVYVEALLKRFCSTYEDPMTDLKNISQKGGSVQVYIDAFDVLMTKVEVPKSQANQCFYCDQKYVPGHKCSGKLYSFEIVEDIGNYKDENGEQFSEGVFGYEDSVVKNRVGKLSECQEEIDMAAQPQILLNAISGVNTFQTIRVKGQINNKPVNILIDCGSTHNFLDITTTKQIGLTWKLQGETFQADMMLIPLGSCEMGRRVALMGAPQPALQWMLGKQLSAKLFSMSVCSYPPFGVQAELMSTCINLDSNNIHPCLSTLLYEYEEVFVVPKSLPPHRFHNHRIPFLNSTAPINIRPYRHPPSQKDAIEAMALMYEVFAPYLRKFALVFLDDILVYSRSVTEHTKHLAQVLEYLGHVIFGKGVATDPSKIKAMQEWPIPVNIKKLREFLGLTGYYRREMEGYLLDRHFKIKIKHFSLKYLMEQRLTTPFQIKWLPKLLGYDYDIVYKKGNENIMVDALSRSVISAVPVVVIDRKTAKVKNVVVVYWLVQCSFFNLPRLQNLTLAYNDFIGSQIPSEIGRFSYGLTHLNLSQCRFSGQVPTEITFLSKLVSLDLSYNQFDLKVHDLKNFFQNFTSMEKLLLKDVNISSTLPTSLNISSSSLKVLNLASTGLRGRLPHNIFNIQNLETLELGDNYLTGYLPLKVSVNLTHLTYLSLNDNTLSGTVPFESFALPSLQVLDISNNQLTGHIDMQTFRKLTNLIVLDLPSNNFSGEWELDTLLTNNRNHEALDLSYGGFSVTTKNHNHYVNPGFIYLNLASCKLKVFPNSFQAIKKLNELDLSSNKIHGHVPLGAGQIGGNELYYVNISRNFITGLPRFHWPKVNELYSQSNVIQGPFPPSICNLSDIWHLDMSNNRFGGVIPQCHKECGKREQGTIIFGYGCLVLLIRSCGEGVDQDFSKVLVDYTIVDLSNNYFDSEIPNIIKNLSSLKVLKLSHNNLYGRIPYSLGNLSEIESLDLSWNQLTEEIPESLAGIKRLKALSLSHNRLVGNIPSGTQFNIFEENAFEGNVGLCGFLLSKNCSEYTHKPQFEAEEHHEEESGFTWEAVMLGYGCGVLLGLVMGYLMLSTRKFKWFNAITNAGEHMILMRKNRRYVFIRK